MAIKKQVMADNGIVTEYHRIAMIKTEVNQAVTILIYSYLSSDGRQIEKDYAAGLYNDIEAGMVKFPYVDTTYVSADYNPAMTVEKAYEYIKTLPQFEDSEDV